MRLYLTHCSAEKSLELKDSGLAVTPDRLYTNPGIQRFMARCQQQQVSWAILSDLYGVFMADEQRVWYEKHPDTVTPAEMTWIVGECDRKLYPYQEIWFYVRSDSFHPFYQTVLDQMSLASRVQLFQNLADIQ